MTEKKWLEQLDDIEEKCEPAIERAVELTSAMRSVIDMDTTSA